MNRTEHHKITIHKDDLGKCIPRTRWVCVLLRKTRIPILKCSRLSIRAQNRFVSKSHPQLYRISLLDHGNASKSICDATEVIRLKYYYSNQNFESQKIIDFLQFQNINRHLLCILLYLLPLILWSSCLRKQINNEQFHRNKFWIWNQLQRSQWSSVRVVPSHTSPKRLSKLWNDRVIIYALDFSLYT